MQLQDAFITYLLRNLSLLTKRDFLVEIFTVTDRLVCPDEEGAVLELESPLYVGKLMLKGDMFVAVKEFTSLGNYQYRIDQIEDTGIKAPADGESLATPYSLITLPAGTLENQPEGEALSTTLGRLLYNYLILAIPFGKTFPYLNQQWSLGKIESMIFDATAQGNITAAQIDSYARNVYFIGHFTELSIPVYTPKSLGTSPEVKKRRAELLEKYKDELANNDPVVMSQIEQELIAMDKEYLKDDKSMDFYSKNIGKSFGVQRKKLYLMGGMTGRFGKPGEFDLIEQSLEEGLTIGNFAKVANDIRAGSYSRAMETQKGGTKAKEIMRALQNVRITEQDCETKRTIPVVLSSSVVAGLYKNRFIVQNNKLVELTPDVLDSYVGQEVKLRSPMTCETENGYCYTCMGKLFSTLDAEVITMRAMAVSAWLLTASLKAMHGVEFKTTEVTDLNDFTF